MLSLALAMLGLSVHATDMDATLGTPSGWQRYDWLSPSATTSATTSGTPPTTGAKITAVTGQDTSDPFAVVTNGSLWQEKYGATYTQALLADLTLSYETSATTLNESSQSFLSPSTDGMADDLTHEQRGGLQFQPIQQFTLSGNVHDSTDDSPLPASSVETRGGGVTAEGHLPLDSVLTVGLNSDTTTTGTLASSALADNTYDAQIKPLGKLPLTAVLKGHYEETTQDGATVTRLPSLEQSVIWKPADTTTVQMGLRQQQYQNFPGVTNELNETLFADWSQTLLPEVTWHSYAEVLNTRGTQDLAPAAPTTTGANGTAQSADPTNTLGTPTSFSDQTVTFSTGPSFKVDQDVSASIEYSNRVDHNPLPGVVGQEQRVSVSLKGTF